MGLDDDSSSNSDPFAESSDEDEPAWDDPQIHPELRPGYGQEPRPEYIGMQTQPTRRHWVTKSESLCRPAFPMSAQNYLDKDADKMCLVGE